jgi:type-F conjugative transfer system pilin assembly protein TrbC
MRGSRVAAVSIALLGGIVMSAGAATDEVKPNVKSLEEYQAISDRALEQARSRAVQEKARQQSATPVTAPLLQVDRLRQTPTTDPAEIAARYKDMKAVMLPPADDLLIFVSSSLPLATLKRLAVQAKAAKAIMVFRGMNGDMRQRASFSKWMKFLEPIIKTGASIQINPLVFTRYQVTSVPSFVLATRDDSCSTEQCKVTSSTIEGDVSLDYALEHWLNQGGKTAQFAQKRLSMMQAAKPK